MRYGGFWRRLSAYLIDLLLLFTSYAIVTTIIKMVQGHTSSAILASFTSLLNHGLYVEGLQEGFWVSLFHGEESFMRFWHQANTTLSEAPYPPLNTILLNGLLVFIFSAVYFAGFEASRLQATPGKLLLGLQVVGVDGKGLTFSRAFYRNFMKVFSTIFGYFGYLMIILTRRRQGLHDKLSRSLIVVRPESQSQDHYPRWYCF